MFDSESVSANLQVSSLVVFKIVVARYLQVILQVIVR